VSHIVQVILKNRCNICVCTWSGCSDNCDRWEKRKLEAQCQKWRWYCGVDPQSLEMTMRHSIICVQVDPHGIA